MTRRSRRLNRLYTSIMLSDTAVSILAHTTAGPPPLPTVLTLSLRSQHIRDPANHPSGVIFVLLIERLLSGSALLLVAVRIVLVLRLPVVVLPRVLGGGALGSIAVPRGRGILAVQPVALLLHLLAGRVASAAAGLGAVGADGSRGGARTGGAGGGSRGGC